MDYYVVYDLPSLYLDGHFGTRSTTCENDVCSGVYVIKSAPTASRPIYVIATKSA